VPFTVVVPLVEVAAPLPRLPFTVPPLRAYVSAVSVPEPPRVPLVIVKLPTVSVFVEVSRVLPLTVTASVFGSVSVAWPRVSVPAATVVPPVVLR